MSRPSSSTGPWEQVGPWEQPHGLQRLRYLKDLPARQGPHGVDLGPDPSTSEFLRSLRAYAVEHVDPELLENRWDAWNILGEHGPADLAKPPGNWWCLRPSEDLIEYKALLMESLQCDFDSVSYWVRLFRIWEA